MRYTASRLGSGSRRLLMSSTTWGKNRDRGREGCGTLSQGGLGDTPWLMDIPQQPLQVQNSPRHSSLPTQGAGAPLPTPSQPLVPTGSVAVGTWPGPGAMALSVLVCCGSLGFSSHPPSPEDEALAVPDTPHCPQHLPASSLGFPSPSQVLHGAISLSG